MSALTDLGNNNGHIIVTRTDGVTIVKAFANSHPGLRQAIGHSLESGTLIGNRAAQGSITVDDLTGMAAESVTAININGNNQIGASVVVGASTLTTYALALSNAINSFTPGAGPDYSADSIGNVVNVIAPADQGSAVNGSAITLVKTNPLILTTETDIDNGSEADTPYDSIIGFRYFLNSILGSGVEHADLSGALEISKNIIMRGLQSTYDTQTITVAASATALSLDRTMIIGNILLNAGAPETIGTINTDGFSIGDQILISNTSGGSAVTINETGNIVLANSSDFVSGDPELVLALKLTDVSGTLKWSEIFRAPNIVISVAAMRAVGIAQPANASTRIILTGGAQSISSPVAGIDPGYTFVTGSPSQTGSFNMVTPSGTVLGRDRFIVDYKATPSDGGGSVTIYGRILSDNEMIEGSTRVEAWYDTISSTWVITKLQDTDGNQWVTEGDIADDAVATDKILNLAVTGPKIALEAVDNAQLKDSTAVSPNKATTTMKRKMVAYELTWESGALGVMAKVFMGGKGIFVNTMVTAHTTIEATNDAGITIFNNTIAATVGGPTLTAGAVQGDTVQFSAFNTPTFDNGDEIIISTSKITPGGTGVLTLVYDARE